MFHFLFNNFNYAWWFALSLCIIYLTIRRRMPQLSIRSLELLFLKKDSLIDYQERVWKFMKLRLVYTGSDMFRSIWDWVHSGTDPLCLHRTGSKLKRYGSTQDHLHKWTHLVPDRHLQRTYSTRETGAMQEMEKHNLTRLTNAPAEFLIQF